MPQKGQHHTLGTRQKLSELRKRKIANGEIKVNFKGCHHSNDTKNILRKKTKERWNNPIEREKLIASFKKRIYKKREPVERVCPRCNNSFLVGYGRYCCQPCARYNNLNRKFPAMLCKCGCGKLAYPGHQYIHGHHLKGKTSASGLNSMCNQKTASKVGKKLKGENNPMYGRCGDLNPMRSEKGRNAYLMAIKKPGFHQKRLSAVLKKRRKNAPWSFLGCGYDSKQESIVAKIRFDLLNVVPIEGKNLHIKVNGCEIDFYSNGIFHEHHPITIRNPKETKEEYYQRRRKLLDDNGYKGVPLVVTTSVDEAKIFYNLLMNITKKE